MAADYLNAKGYKNVAIVSHSLGATMANQYLINTDDKTVKAWVFVGIINGLEEMFRIKIPVLDVFGSKDWEITQVGAYERKKQITKINGSDQIVVPEALHFFEGREDELVRIIVDSSTRSSTTASRDRERRLRRPTKKSVCAGPSVQGPGVAVPYRLT